MVSMNGTVGAEVLRIGKFSSSLVLKNPESALVVIPMGLRRDGNVEQYQGLGFTRTPRF